MFVKQVHRVVATNKIQKHGHGKIGEEIIKQIDEVLPFLSHCTSSVSELGG